MKFEFFIHDRRVRPWGQALVAARSWCCDERCTTDVADLPRFELGNMNMAIAGRAPSGDSASRGVRSGTGGFGALSAHAAKLLALAALSLTMALAGCAQNSAQHEVKTDPIEAAAPPQGHPDFRIRRPNRALIATSPRLRVQVNRAQDGGSGSMGAPETRLRAAMLPTGGEEGPRPFAAAAGVQQMRD